MNPMIQGWKAVAQDFGAQLSQCSAEQLDAQTPCSEWTVRELVEHTLEVQRGIPSQLGADLPEGAGDDPSATWQQMMPAIEAALSAEGALASEVETPFGKMPASQALGLPTNDLLVHTWDLGQALGNQVTLNEAAVSHAFESLKPLDAMIRQPGMFDAKVEVADDADTQTQFIAFTGRQP